MNLQFSILAKNGIDKIYAEDFESQEHYINIIAEEVRHMDSKILFDMKAFFVPNDEYMIEYFGIDIVRENFDCYSTPSICHWSGFIVFPLTDVFNNIVGFVGFNSFNRLRLDEDFTQNSYRDSGRILIDKSKYLFMPQNKYEKFLEDNYIFITDGVFDTISFNANGINAGALLGSYLSEEVIAQIKLFDRVYIPFDNDTAGLKLYNRIKPYCNAIAVKQNKFKDSDDILKSEFKEEYLTKIRQSINSENPFDLVFRF